MKWKPGLTTLLVVFLTAVFLTASCAKKEVVKIGPAPAAQPEVSKTPDPAGDEAAQPPQQQETISLAEIPKASDILADEAEQAEKLEKERLRAEAAAREAARKAFVGQGIHFAFDSAALSDQARQILDGQAGYLRTNPDVTVTVEGHCDERGTEAYNLKLGQQRAEAVKNFMVDRGVSADRLSIVSFGEDRPVASGQNEASWAKNRRAQFVIN